MEQLKALQEQVEHLTKLIKELAKPDIYDYIDENMPEWARKPVQAAVDKGILKGDKENGWGLTYEDLKVLTWYILNYYSVKKVQRICNYSIFSELFC